MSEETQTGEGQGMQIGGAGTGQAGQQSVQLLLDEREMRTAFANAYRIHHAAEEVVLDFGFNMANPNYTINSVVPAKISVRQAPQSHIRSALSVTRVKSSRSVPAVPSFLR